MSLQVTREDDGPHIVLRVVGDINAANAETLETPLIEAATEPSTKLTIDLAAVEYISSAGLRLFMMAAKRLRTRGERLSLRGVQPSALIVLQMANFTSFLDIVA
jgi:anti-anti-sigma factor